MSRCHFCSIPCVLNGSDRGEQAEDVLRLCGATLRVKLNRHPPDALWERHLVVHHTGRLVWVLTLDDSIVIGSGARREALLGLIACGAVS